VRGGVRGMKISGYLEKRRAGFVAVVEVPPRLRETVGRKRFTKGLSTQDIHVAEARLMNAVVGLHARIKAACKQHPATDNLTAEAMAYREEAARIRSGDVAGWGASGGRLVELEDGRLVTLTAEQEAEEALSTAVIARAEDIEASEGASRASAFADMAFGRSTPLAHHVETWLVEPGRKGRRHERTKAEYRALVAAFGDWLAKQRHPVTVEAVSRQVAGAYASALLAAGRSDARIRDVCSAMSGYWRWLEYRGIAKEGANPWPRQAPRKVAQEDSLEERERAFTPEEMRKLLGGPADAALSDLMHIAALTGMRVEEICQLTAARCTGPAFDVPGTKTAAAIRRVPVHPDLRAIIVRRTKDKAGSEWLFPEWGEPNRFGKRSANAIARFNRYRQELGVHEAREGRRRSLVNFHSFRRWFITEALRAGQLERVVKQVVGHKLPKADVTVGVYFAGDTTTALTACVEAVKLPPMGDSPGAPPPTRQRLRR